MPKATSTLSTLCLNKSNDASIPEKGLELPAGVATPVTAQQAAYLASLPGVVITPDSGAAKAQP
jgi:hypothetical protein